MAKVLLTWEGGAYLGHQMLVSSAAAVLHAAGHVVVIVAPAGVPANAAARSLGLRWETISAPPDEPRAPPGVPWESRATTLWEFGFRSEALLRDRFHAWDVVLQREQPDIAFLQAAPFAQLAAHVAGLASVEFGIGFDVPPRQRPFPAFRHPETFQIPDAVLLEQHLMDRITRVVGRAAKGRALHDMVSAPLRLVTSIHELDHYDGHEDPTRSFVGPLPVAELGPAGPAWQRRGPRVLAYVRAHLLHMSSFLKALAALRGDAVVVCPDAAPEHLAQARTLKLRLHVAPVSLGGLLPAADLVVSHAGGLMAEALVRGRPCVALPSHYEQFMTALTLKRRKLGVVVNPAEPASYERALRHALGDAEIRRNAVAVGMRYRGAEDAAAESLRRAAANVA